MGEWYLKTYISENPVVTDDAYYDGAQTDVTIKRLEQLAKDSKPFFYAIGYYRPHMPFNVPKKYWDMYDRAKIPLAKNDYVPRNCP
ncbi:MAG: idsA4, partial [Bacteroidetes bacterium]|nr:idsA4 [Bacteroidota bacterium]